MTEIILHAPVGEITTTGWNLPQAISREDWEAAGKSLKKLDNSSQWWLGDWWKACEWGDGEQACAEIGVDYGVARNAGSVAASFKMSRRRDKLSFSHHNEVCVVRASNPENVEEVEHCQAVQDRMLDWCLIDPDTGAERDKPQSVRALREYVKAYISEAGWTEEEKARRQMVLDGRAIVVHAKNDQRLIDWARLDNLAVKIDRGSCWGNPFLLDKDGDRNDVCNSYAVYLDLKPSLLTQLHELKGKVLICWCHPERCHGDELAERANAL